MSDESPPLRALKRIERVLFVERVYGGYRRRDNWLWALKLDCGHGRMLQTTTSAQPHGGRDCGLCAYPADPWWKVSSETALSLLEPGARGR